MKSNTRTKKPTKKDFLSRIAVHEAGHAVVALCLGLDVRMSTILGRGDEWGRTVMGYKPEYASATYEQMMELIGHRVITTYSGWAAEKVTFGSADLRFSADDFANAHSVLSELVGKNGQTMNEKTMKAVSRTGKARALDMARKNKEFISAVARELLKKKTLGADELLSLYLYHKYRIRVSADSEKVLHVGLKRLHSFLESPPSFPTDEAERGPSLGYKNPRRDPRKSRGSPSRGAVARDQPSVGKVLP